MCYFPVPLCMVNLMPELVIGVVTVRVVTSLSIKRVDFLLEMS